MTQNVLVQITLPKRTGRRRKKDSRDPFDFPATEMEGQGSSHQSPKWTETLPSASLDGPKDLLRSLQDNTNNYSVQILGLVEQTHRFRSLPDFVFSTRRSPFMRRVRKHVMPLDYEALKGFQFDPSQGPKIDEDLIPPPWFTTHSLPFKYGYRQNPAVKQTVDASGKIAVVNPSKWAAVKLTRIAADAPSVPQGPDPKLAPIESLDMSLQVLIEQIQAKMVGRPIWSRRALANELQSRDWGSWGKRVLQYVAYEFRSGPWRDLSVKFGVDPRSDPKYRIYQSMTFQFDDEVRQHEVTPVLRKGQRVSNRKR